MASSMRRSSFHFAMRSDRAKLPTLIWPASQPVARWAMETSSVSPDRAETMAPHFSARAASSAAFARVTVPAWFTFTSTALPALASAVRRTRSALVTRMSSPMSCTRSPYSAVAAAKPARSSWLTGSSIDRIG